MTERTQEQAPANPECLHCGILRGDARRQRAACEIWGGYEYVELEEEWPRHRWRDWTDADLAASDIRPDAYERHRRDPVRALSWTGCDDTTQGHVPAAAADISILADHIGQCVRCGHRQFQEATP